MIDNLNKKPNCKKKHVTSVCHPDVVKPYSSHMSVTHMSEKEYVN